MTNQTRILSDDPPPLERSMNEFVESLSGRNLSALTIQAYQTDIVQFLEYLFTQDWTLTKPSQVTKSHITGFLSHLAGKQLTGVTRARKLAAIKEFFRYVTDNGAIPSSPAESVAMPKRERRSRVYLRTEEYMRMLAQAGGNARDFAILQLFLQSGIRVSELCNLQLAHLDLKARTLHIDQAKGKKDRVIELEKKATQALQNYLDKRPDVLDDHIFLNYEGRGLSIRGVQDVVEKYAKRAGITKRISAHSLRHTFGTYKAERGVSAFQLQQWLGHSSVATTQQYVHMGKESARRAMEATSL